MYDIVYTQWVRIWSKGIKVIKAFQRSCTTETVVHWEPYMHLELQCHTILLQDTHTHNKHSNVAEVISLWPPISFPRKCQFLRIIQTPTIINNNLLRINKQLHHNTISMHFHLLLLKKLLVHGTSLNCDVLLYVVNVQNAHTTLIHSSNHHTPSSENSEANIIDSIFP